MQPFDEEAVLEASTAKQDKLEITMGDWDVAGYDAQPGRMLLTQLIERRHGTEASLDGLRWFTARQNHLGINSVRFSSGRAARREQQPYPIISGEIYVKGTPNANDTAYRSSLTVNLSINPTRFASHHASRLRNRIINRDLPENDETLLLSRERPARRISEYSLDGADNVLLSQRARSSANEDRWPYLLRHHITNVIEWIEVALAEAAIAVQVSLRRKRSWCINLKKAETYWEFSCDNALITMHELRPTLTALGSESRATYYRVQSPTQDDTELDGGETDEAQRSPRYSEERRHNSPTVWFRPTSTISARIYAKTNRRIRFEFIHDLVQSSAVLPDGRHTTPDVDELLNWFDAIASDAAERGNRILTCIGAREWQRAAQRPLFAFLAGIVEACDHDEAIYEHVLSLLVANGSVVLANNDPLRAVVHRLANRGILVRSLPYSQTFLVEPSYQRALADLQRRPN